MDRDVHVLGTERVLDRVELLTEQIVVATNDLREDLRRLLSEQPQVARETAVRLNILVQRLRLAIGPLPTHLDVLLADVRTITMMDRARASAKRMVDEARVDTTRTLSALEGLRTVLGAKGTTAGDVHRRYRDLLSVRGDLSGALLDLDEAVAEVMLAATSPSPLDARLPDPIDAGPITDETTAKE